jgi:DNA repair exonuclease SbcCD ATPase subunit
MQIIVKSISGKGFLTFKDTFIQDFEKFGNAPVLIVGENHVDVKSLSNGSGKSSLIEALNFVFFGTTGRALKYADEVINWDSDECKIFAEIQVGQECYEIKRERKIGKATTLDIYHMVGVERSGEVLPQADNKTKQAWLEHLLGFSFTSWSCAVMFHQDFVAFPDLKPPQRAEILSEVADLDIYLEAAKLSSKKLNLINNRVNLLEHDIITRLQSLERLKVTDYQEKIEQFETDRQQRIIGLRKQQRDEKTKYEDEKKKSKEELFVNSLKIEECNERITELEHKKTLPIDKPELIKLSNKIIYLEAKKGQTYISPKELGDRTLELVKELENLPNVEEQLHSQIKYDTEINSEIAVLVRDIEKLSLEIHKFQTLGIGICPTCKQAVSTEHLQDRLTDMESDLLVLETKRFELNKKKESSAITLKGFQDLYSLLKKYERELEVKRRERQKLELNYIENTNTEINLLRDEKYKIETDHLNHLNDLIQNFKEQLHALELEQQSLQIKIASDTGEKLVAALESQIESTRQLENIYIGLKLKNDQQIKEVQQEIDAMQEEVDIKKEKGNYLSYWIDGYKRLRMMMFDSFIIRLEELSQDQLSEYSTELTISITGEKDLKGGGKKDEIYIEVINTKGKKSSFEAYSGGERQKVKMAVSLALAEVIKEKCGKDFNIVVFDEPNNALDDIGKDTNFQVFKKIAENKTLLCVDHEGYFQDRFDQVITIVKEENGSRIAI